MSDPLRPDEVITPSGGASAQMKKLAADTKASDNPQFPKIFAGQYGTEISTLSLDPAKLVHTSFWGGDIEAFVLQALVRGFF